MLTVMYFYTDLLYIVIQCNTGVVLQSKFNSLAVILNQNVSLNVQLGRSIKGDKLEEKVDLEQKIIKLFIVELSVLIIPL